MVNLFRGWQIFVRISVAILRCRAYRIVNVTVIAHDATRCIFCAQIGYNRILIEGAPTSKFHLPNALG